MRLISKLHERIIVCRRCPRLVEHREAVGRTKKPAYSEWNYWSRPVPGFGDPLARLVIVGLAPASHGGNRTGRVFTGDTTAAFLMRALHEAGYANQPASTHKDDGLLLHDAYLCAAVRCAPPNDRPNAGEIYNCLPFLREELELLPRAKVVLALGRIAFQSAVYALCGGSAQRNGMVFRHGAKYALRDALPLLVASYHPSPRNTNTGRLTKGQLVSLLRGIRSYLG